MNYILPILISTLFITVTNEAAAQPEPKAVITFKTSQKSDPFILKINDLTGGDDHLTEQVVFEIGNIKTTNIKRIVTKNEFSNLSNEIKKEAITYSEVKEIIERLRN